MHCCAFVRPCIVKLSLKSLCICSVRGALVVFTMGDKCFEKPFSRSLLKAQSTLPGLRDMEDNRVIGSVKTEDDRDHIIMAVSDLPISLPTITNMNE